jgi:hypothetical protein
VKKVLLSTTLFTFKQDACHSSRKKYDLRIMLDEVIAHVIIFLGDRITTIQLESYDFAECDTIRTNGCVMGTTYIILAPC